jgi:hypothetical protein
MSPADDITGVVKFFGAAPGRRAPEQDDDTIQTEEAIQHLRRYFHIYEGWSYYTLRCEICQQMFGIKPNAPILERSSFDMLMNHAKMHNKTPTCPLDYSRRYTGEGEL